MHSCSLFPFWLCPNISLASLLPSSKVPLHNNFAVSSFYIYWYPAVLEDFVNASLWSTQFWFCFLSDRHMHSITILFLCFSVCILASPSYKLILNLLCAALYGAPPFHPSLFCAPNHGGVPLGTECR